MKLLLVILLIVCMVLFGVGCQWRGGLSGGIFEGLDKLAGNLGSSQIAQDDSLIGQRTYADDNYSGVYFADCIGLTGRDVIFGGGSIEDRVLHCYGKVSTESGEACVRVRLNEEVYLLTLDSDGCFDTELHLRSGGNYVMVDYNDFVGTVKVICEYIHE